MRVIRPYEQSLFTLRALLVTATLLLVLGAFGTSASAQAGAAVSVDPSSGLVDEQVVEITGSGLTVDAHEAVVIRQCAAGAETAADCDFATTRYVGHNAGEWTLQAVVWREIDLLGGSRDCALEACEIVVSSSGEFENLASTRLTFDLAVPANLRPAVSLEPSEDLVDEQVVTLSGAGFKPFTHLSFMQCSLVSTDEHGGGCSYSEQSDSTEIDGTFSVEITVRRLLRSSEVGGVVDCANSGCMIRVRGGNRSPAPLALSFDPEVPLPPGPRMAVRPHNGLVDGQFVKVVARAEGLQWGQFLQCAANEEGVDYQQCRHLRPVFDEAGEGVGDDPPPSPATTEPPAELASADQVADGGVLRVRVQLRREIRSGGHGSQGPPAQVVDCAESAGRCVLVLISESQVRQAVRPLEFDTTVPGLKAKVTIERRNGLVSGEKLKIRVSDSLAETVQARQCPRDAVTHDDERCQIIGRVFRHQRASTARFTIVMTPRRIIGSQTGEPFDCAEKKACDIRVSGSDGPMRRLLVNFAPVDNPGVPSLRVSGRRGLTDGKTVKVRVIGPKSGWVILQCQASAGSRNRSCSKLDITQTRTTAAATKGVAVLRRRVGQVDCATEPRRCELRLAFHNFNVDSVPLIFESSGPSPGAPALSVRPRKNLVHGQTVAITARNVTGRVALQQCLADDDSQHPLCRSLGGGRAVDGKFTNEVAVHRLVGEVDCAETAGRCTVRVTENHGRVLASKPLRFDRKGPLPPELVLRARPNSDLVDFQSIEVTIKNRGEGYVSIRQCAVIAGELAEGSCRRLAELGGGHGPQTSELDIVPVVVRRSLSARGAESSWDCAQHASACVIAVDVHDPAAFEAIRHKIALRFDPDGPPFAELSMKVRPRRGLADGQRVNVVVDGLEGSAQFRQCPFVDGELLEQHCIGLGNVDRQDKTAGQRAVLAVTVRRILSDQSGSSEPFDCALVRRSCVVILDQHYGEGHGSGLQVTLNFDP